MFDVEEQTKRVEKVYRQIVGSDPKRGSDPPIAPIPPDANPEQYVQENLQRLQAVLQGTGISPIAPGLGPAFPTFAPRVALFEDKQDWTCAVELPGVKKSDLNVQITQGVLRISAHRSWPGINGEPQRPIYFETMPCRFERSLPVPPFSKCDSAQAKLESGVLTVRCQKDISAVQKDLKIEVA